MAFILRVGAKASRPLGFGARAWRCVLFFDRF